VQLRLIQELLGHEDPKTTLLYTQISEVSAQNRVKEVNSLLRARPAQTELPKRPAFKCPDCGSAMAIKGFRCPGSSRSPPAAPLHLHN